MVRSQLRLVSDSGQEIPIRQDSVLLGRDRSCAVWLDDRSISRRHAAIQRDGEGWLILDQGSANGVLLDGRKVSRAPLLDGQELRLGLLSFRVAIGPSDDAATVIVNRAAFESEAGEARTPVRAVSRSPDRPLYWLPWAVGGAVVILVAAFSVMVVYLVVTRGETADRPAAATTALASPSPESGPKREGAVLLVVAEEPCELYVDGIHVTRLVANRVLRHSVDLGEHIVSASADDGRGFQRVFVAQRAEQQFVVDDLVG